MFCYLICNNWSLIKNFILKNGLPSNNKVAYIYFNKKVFKNDEKCVLFPVKMSLFVLKIFKFLSWLFWLCKKWLDEKTKVSKFMTSQTGILTITTRILSNFSWSKSSQTMKFILLIEYKMRNIFLEKSSPNSFYKNQNWAYRWMNILKCYKFRCYDCPSRVVSVQVSKCWLLAFTSHEGFFQKKGRSRTCLPVTFSAWFLKKNISHFICY